ncbi:MAG: glucose-1-phosphate thymidylyltransferase [Bacteroidetes bacterium]|nr:glucose-1-phosphate thymidylyltransferase [Bacteroidota bacterium]
MKAIIPVAGAGTKLRPHSYTQPKALIPLAGKTILSIIVDQLREAGITDFIFIVGYFGKKIEDYVRQLYPDLQVSFVHQTDRQGVGHAIQLTRDQVGTDEVFVVLGDTICEFDIESVLQSPYSMVGLRKVDDPREFGVAEIDEQGKLLHLVEKPNIPTSNLALVGVYKILETALLFDCLQKNIQAGVQSRGEFSLTDALECMIAAGADLRSFRVENWFDCGRKETLLESNQLLLKKFAPAEPINPYENCVLIPPVSIGQGCTIQNSIIGPHVAIGDHSVVEQCIVENSIIGSYARLSDIVLSDSLIGSDTQLKGESRSLNIGDNTSIDLG